MNILKTTTNIIIKAALIIIGVLGIVFTALSSAFMGGASVFFFFNVQSNIFIMLMALIFLINEVVVLITNKSFINQTLLHIKYVATVAITVTFLVFFTMLAPIVGIDYLLSFNNFSLHAIVPILAIVDFFVFDKDIDMTYPKAFLGLAMPAYYLVFFIICTFFGTRYTGANDDSAIAPYFFLNYKQNGFLFEKGTIGVIPWSVILLVAIALLSLLFAFLMRLRQGKITKKN